MFHYLFTNDIRISTLKEKISEAARMIQNDTVPTASENKSLNNNINTLKFYFGLEKDNNNTKAILNNRFEEVIFNFMSKFQFPNPRTKDSYIKAVEDKILLHPYRIIVKLLFVGKMSNNDFRLSEDEIFYFVFLNSKVAKSDNINYIELYNDVMEYKKSGELPDYIANDADAWEWKHKDRQLGELLGILNWSGWVTFENGEVSLQETDLSYRQKSFIFDMLNHHSAFYYNEKEDFSTIKERYLKYFEIGDSTDNSKDLIKFSTSIKSDFPRNKIIFGAPGTGKSYKLNKDMEKLLDNGGSYERVTFHPDYSYSSFVGTYKPVPEKDDNGNDIITYKYIPGPFMRLYVKAMKSVQSDEPKPHLLIIEEINRASVAAVFGEIFQLLDRKNNISEYPIQTSEDMRGYLASELGGSPQQYNQIKLPDNMFLWATMNSADQGVFPMDTAFKRRWTFEYLGIDENEELISPYYIHIKQNDVNWNCLRKAINQELSNFGINEDKLMGPFFINMSELTDNSSKKENNESTLVSEESPQYDSLVAEVSSDYSNGNESIHKKIVDNEKFAQVFKNKVIMYLFEDAAKQKVQTLFKGVSREDRPGSKIRYSEICDAYDQKGIKIFSDKIVDAVIND